MKKLCVFCGSEISNKTREHVIPKWLMQLTGDPNREVYLGINWNKIVSGVNIDKDNIESIFRKFRFSSFQFPACESCNRKFSNLENSARESILKILEGKTLKVKNIHDLLDWFDKLRIGLWLGYRYLNKNIASITPKFAIQERMGIRDRMLAIYKLKNITDGINFLGADTLAFQHIPSCFALRINEYYFFNLSKEFLFAKNIGFPYPVNIEYQQDNINAALYKLKNGNKSIKYPLLKKEVIFGAVEIYQPMIDRTLCINSNTNEFEELYENEYVKNNVIDYEKGIGAIFIKDDNHLKKYINTDDEIDFTFKKTFDGVNFSSKDLPRLTYEYQIHLLKNDGDISKLSKEDQKHIEKQRRISIKINEYTLKKAIKLK
jgi:hypothetical protein